jgi:hypothetical protein
VDNLPMFLAMIVIAGIVGVLPRGMRVPARILVAAAGGVLLLVGKLSTPLDKSLVSWGIGLILAPVFGPVLLESLGRGFSAQVAENPAGADCADPVPEGIAAESIDDWMQAAESDGRDQGKPVCPHCGHPYNPADYRPDARAALCPACKGALLIGASVLPQYKE